MTLGELWRVYAAARKPELRSWQTVEGHGRHLLRILGADRDPATLTLEDIDAYRARRRTERTPRGEICRPATRNHETSSLRAMLNFAVARKRLAVNPLGGMKREREDNVRQTALSEDDLAKLLPKCCWWLKPLVLLAFDSGMRRNELRLLRNDQLEADGGAVLISPKNTKTGRGRRIPLTSRTSAALRAHPRFGEYVFSNPARGTPWGKGTLDEAFRKAVKAAGLKGATGETVRFHDLRRSFATNARRRGLSETLVMKLTGHRTRAVFERYNICDDGELDGAVALMEAGGARERGDKPTPPAPPAAPVAVQGGGDLEALVAKAVQAALSARSEQPRRGPARAARAARGRKAAA